MHLTSARSVVLPAFSALLALSALAGCASQSPDPPTASPAGVTGTAAEPLQAAAMPTAPVDLLRRGGSFLFSLDESSPAARMREKCSQESAGDTARAAVCYAQIREVGSHEGMRFALDAWQRIVLTSFGQEDGKDAVYLEGPVSLRADGDHAVVATFVAPPHGLQVDGRPEELWQKPFQFELQDESTLVMNDAVKGRLVFHRAQP